VIGRTDAHAQRTETAPNMTRGRVAVAAEAFMKDVRRREVQKACRALIGAEDATRTVNLTVRLAIRRHAIQFI
jgi:hypothetical protein